MIKNPLIAFLTTIFVATFPNSYFSILNGRKLTIFESNALIPIVAATFLMFNFSPFDIIFRVFWFLSPLLAFVDGYLVSCTMISGIDMATRLYPHNWILVLVIGVTVSSGKYILVYVIGKIIKSERKARSPGPVIFIASLGALAYYWLTDLGHISSHFCFGKEEMRFYVVVVVSLLMFIRLCVSDLVFTKIWNMVGEIGWLIPYYGKMWTPLSVECNKKYADEGPHSPDEAKISQDASKSSDAN